jgi:hypothetical protein
MSLKTSGVGISHHEACRCNCLEELSVDVVEKILDIICGKGRGVEEQFNKRSAPHSVHISILPSEGLFLYAKSGESAYGTTVHFPL